MLKIIIGMIIPFCFHKIIVSQYSFIQSHHYEIYKYFKSNLKQKNILFVMQALSIIGTVFSKNNTLCMILFFSIIMNSFLINKNKVIYTKRIIRYLIILYIFIISFFVLIPFNIIKSIILTNSILLILIVVAHYISLILENTIMCFYIKEAKKKIKNIKIIGITGSYGKTSSKNILYNLIEDEFNVSKTPKSFNTKIGIVKSIRENVSLFDDIFICEYGVDKKGGMDKLLKIVKPNIALITEVGNQHLLTFKNIENIKKEKIKLAKILNENEYAVINNDNKYLKEEIKNLKCKTITYGIENKSDIMAKNIKISNKGSTFDLVVNDKKIKTVTIKLLGIHNVLNTLGAIGVLKALNVKLDKLDNLAKNIKQVEHRLQLKKMDGIDVIDDSFNSNETGFKNAIDVLKMMDKEKVVITPGIIEQGENSENINYKLGKYMADKVDCVYLVEKNAGIIKKGLIDGGFDCKKIYVKSKFLDAWGMIKQDKEVYKKIILIENDLPSIYLK